MIRRNNKLEVNFQLQEYAKTVIRKSQLSVCQFAFQNVCIHLSLSTQCNLPDCGSIDNYMLISTQISNVGVQQGLFASTAKQVNSSVKYKTM